MSAKIRSIEVARLRRLLRGVMAAAPEMFEYRRPTHMFLNPTDAKALGIEARPHLYLVKK